MTKKNVFKKKNTLFIFFDKNLQNRFFLSYFIIFFCLNLFEKTSHLLNMFNQLNFCKLNYQDFFLPIFIRLLGALCYKQLSSKKKTEKTGDKALLLTIFF